MPWSSQGGGPRKPNDNGPWGQGPGGGGPPGGGVPPDLEELLRRGQDGLRQLLPSGLGGRGVAILALLTLLAWLASGFYTVGPNEVGLNLIFGKYRGKTQAGLNYNLPSPIGTVVKLAVTDRNAVDIGFREQPATRRRPAGARGAGRKPHAHRRREYRRRQIPASSGRSIRPIRRITPSMSPIRRPR